MLFKHGGIRLEKLTREYLPRLLALKEESWFGTHNVSILNSEDQERWYAGLDNHPTSPRHLYLIAITYNNPNVHSEVGVFKITHIDWPNGGADIGWDVFAFFRGKGFGKGIAAAGAAFAFEALGLRRLTAEILETNEISQRCAAHAGFVLEGRKREAVWKGGKYVDSLVYGALKADHFSRINGPAKQGDSHGRPPQATDS